MAALRVDRVLREFTVSSRLDVKMGACLTEQTETTVNFNRVCFMVCESYPNMNTSRRENIQRKKRRWEEWVATPADWVQVQQAMV